jgi:hypothetical protein
MQHCSTTTIVLLLLTGAAAFSAHQQAEQHPGAIAVVTDAAGAGTGKPVSQHDSAQIRMSPLAAIRCAEQKLWLVSADLHSPSTEKRSSATSRARPLIKAISALQTEIDQSGDSSELEKREARMITLRATYLGAREIPDEYAPQFVTIALGIVQRETGSDEAAEAEALMLLERTAWGECGVDAVVGDLERFAGNYPNSLWAVSLYGLAAEEYQRKGLAESANAVLERGIRFYSGQSQAAVLASKLAEQGPAASLVTPSAGKQNLQHFVSGEACSTADAGGSKSR